jgi:hypothetical protein
VKPIRVEFCGEWYEVTEPDGLSIGREADLVLDDNPYLHRRFLQLSPASGLWWLGNTGNLLSATVTDPSGQVQAWLAPGARLPIVFERLHVLFSAGATTYDLTVHGDAEFYATSSRFMDRSGATTIEPVPLTSSQRLCIVVLCEPMLRDPGAGRGRIPTSAEAAQRLGWSTHTFSRKLDNVCEKFDRAGVPGLRGGRGNGANERRARLVEYAIASRLATVDDLPLLDRRSADGEGAPSPDAGAAHEDGAQRSGAPTLERSRS